MLDKQAKQAKPASNGNKGHLLHTWYGLYSKVSPYIQINVISLHLFTLFHEINATVLFHFLKIYTNTELCKHRKKFFCCFLMSNT